MRVLVAATLAMAACSGDGDEGTATYAPALEFLSPTEGATVPAGDVPVSIVVTDFDLVAPTATARVSPLPWALLATSALAHDEEGAPSGYVELTLDGAVVGQMDGTQFTVTGVAAGAHELVGELLFADGDALESPVVVSIAFIAE